MNDFKIIDISGDVGLKVFGKSINDIFVNAAMGMYNLITNLEPIKEDITIHVSVGGGSIDGLFVSWLNELIFQFDAYGFIGKKIKITEFTTTLTLPPQGEGKGGGEADQITSLPAYKLKATISGEKFDPERHEGKLLIKAATYHRLRIEKADDAWEAEVIFDI